MTRRPARLGVVLALVIGAAAGQSTAAAAVRFVPTDPHFVVANVRQAVPDEELRTLIAEWRPGADDASSAALGIALLRRAETLREPMYVGRAEAVLETAARRPGASATVRRLYAETLQYRHEFAAALSLLDAILAATPRDAAARQQRASVRLVRGDFAGARRDCAELLTGGGVYSVALACLAEAMAGSGQLQQGLALLQAYPLRDAGDAEARAYFLAVRAELHERNDSAERALADYSAAVALAPQVESIRAALADLLLARGAPRDAADVLSVERPGLGLAVRQVACARALDRETLRARAASWLQLEAARGDALHYREAALLALADRDARAALDAARANFELQKELPDVRVLARAALAAQDAQAQRVLRTWMRDTGFRDVVTENLLAGVARG